MRLDLGAGMQRHQGYLAVDVLPGADIVIDLEKERLSDRLGENTVAAMRSSHFFEHLSPAAFLRLMEDCWRVSCPGARWEWIVPHRDAEIGNPYHLNPHFTEWTFRFFDVHGVAEARWGIISKGTAHEAHPCATRELSCQVRNGQVFYECEVAK